MVEVSTRKRTVRREFQITATVSIDAYEDVEPSDVFDRVVRWARKNVKGTGALELLELGVQGDGNPAGDPEKPFVVPPPARHEHEPASGQ